MMTDLFGELDEPRREELAAGAVLLRGRALPLETSLLTALGEIVARAPFRRMTTPGGFEMSVAMTNCGRYGWVSSESGYRYAEHDPLSGAPWPAMPAAVRELACAAAAAAGFETFQPDACLVNRYEPGTRLTLHQDKNERDFREPIVRERISPIVNNDQTRVSRREPGQHSVSVRSYHANHIAFKQSFPTAPLRVSQLAQCDNRAGASQPTTLALSILWKRAVPRALDVLSQRMMDLGFERFGRRDLDGDGATIDGLGRAVARLLQ